MSSRTAPHLRFRPTTERAHALLEELNDRQREAVMTIRGPLLIIAGAGSGKTKTLTHRVAYLIEAGEVPPEQILAVTFTNKAAREMRQRIAGLLGRHRQLPTVGTFHGFCARVLRRYGHVRALPPTFTIYDEGEACSVMKSVMADVGLSTKTISPHAVLGAISVWKDDLRTIADTREAARDAWEERAADLWNRYEHRLQELHAVDFDGLLYHAVTLLREHEEIRANLEEQYHSLSVDEYQDTNQSQAVLLKLLSGSTNNICAVGDDAQAIYGWRGARIENIRSFPQHFPGCVTIALEQNYRSTQAILSAANALIGESTEAFPKTLWTRNARGVPPHLLRASDETSEGRKILRVLQRLFATTPYGPADAAILYRTNAQSRALEEACLHTGIPYEIVGGLTFYERKEVKDIVAYLTFLQNPLDALAFRRIANVPTRGVGERTIERCLVEARRRATHPLDPAVRETLPEVRQRGLADLSRIVEDLRPEIPRVPPVTFVDLLLEKTRFRDWLREEERRTEERPGLGESRYENVLELRTVAERHETLTDFLEEISLMSDAEKTSSARDNQRRLKLMTIHAAKGLEFPIVVVAGMEEGLLPHQNALDTSRGLEEERRLCYVAVTRAREHLFLSYARTRTIYGTKVETHPSRFLDDLPEYSGEGDDVSASSNAAVENLDEEPTIRVDDGTASFVLGERVRHEQFGEGSVESVDGTIITVRFRRGVTLLDSTQAPLQRLGNAHDIEE